MIWPLSIPMIHKLFIQFNVCLTISPSQMNCTVQRYCQYNTALNYIWNASIHPPIPFLFGKQTNKQKTTLLLNVIKINWSTSKSVLLKISGHKLEMLLPIGYKLKENVGTIWLRWFSNIKHTHTILLLCSNINFAYWSNNCFVVIGNYIHILSYIEFWHVDRTKIFCQSAAPRQHWLLNSFIFQWTPYL